MGGDPSAARVSSMYPDTAVYVEYGTKLYLLIPENIPDILAPH